MNVTLKCIEICIKLPRNYQFVFENCRKETCGPDAKSFKIK